MEWLSAEFCRHVGSGGWATMFASTGFGAIVAIAYLVALGIS